MPRFVDKVKVIPKYGANKLVLTIRCFFSIVTVTNPAIPKNNPHRIDDMSRLLFYSRFKYILLLNVSRVTDLSPYEMIVAEKRRAHAGQD